MKQEQKTKSRRWIAFGIVLFCAGMAAAARWDLQINLALYDPKNPIAVAFECFGYYVQYVPVLLWWLCLAADAGQELWVRCVMGVLTAGGAVALGANTYSGLTARGAAMPGLWCAAVWALLLLGGALLLQARVQRARLEFAFGWAFVLMLANNVIINVLKLIWNRTRFDDMLAAGSFADFTAWMHPFGNGGTSFPSGHTAAACGIFVLVLLCDVLPAWNRHRTAVWGVCWAYIGSMAFNRIVIGRHFLSDTLMAAFTIALLFLLMTHTKLYRRTLARLCADGAASESTQASPENRCGELHPGAQGAAPTKQVGR
ncbi:MAG: phosphatase PAP2 family protein [Ruthenibacterium sp.]